jgi:hypothetical protein
MNEDVTNSQKDWEDFWSSEDDDTKYTKEKKEHLLNAKLKYYDE